MLFHKMISTKFSKLPMSIEDCFLKDRQHFKQGIVPPGHANVMKHSGTFVCVIISNTTNFVSIGKVVFGFIQF